MEGLNKVIRGLDKVGIFSRWTNTIGLAALFLMICWTFIDVIMRYVFNSPMKWASEMVEIGMIVAIFLAIAHTQNEKSHISVDIITTKLSPRGKLIMQFISNLIGVCIFAVLIWQTIGATSYALETNQIHTQTLRWNKAPFLIIMTIGLSCLWLLLLRDLLRNIVEHIKMGARWKDWLVMITIPIIIIVFALIWMQPDIIPTSLTAAGLIGILFCLILFLMGMPISFSLILTAFIFSYHIRGPGVALDILATEPYRTTGSFSYAAVSFFVMVGYFCLYARFGSDLYYACYKWFGHLPGGVALATIGACTGFAAIVGDSASACATMGSVSLPEMRKYKYNDRLSAGSVCAGSSLGPIIPPSVTFIFYGLFAKVAVGDLFVAGLIPGIIMALIFCTIIYVWCKRSPQVGPPGAKAGWVERFISLKAAGPVLILFVLVIGGIYMGVFTPTEGGSIGAMISFLLALIMRRWTWKSFTSALADSGKVISMVFLIIIGAVMFTRFMAWCNMSLTIQAFFNEMNLSPTIYILIVLFVFFILGCVMDILPLLLIGVPILHPIAAAMGINPIWFAVMVVIVINLGSLTPPVGLILFVFKGIARDVSMADIYAGALPFVMGSLVAVVLVFFIPSLATWLPAALK